MEQVYQFFENALKHNRLANSYLLISREDFGQNFDKISFLVLNAPKNLERYAIRIERMIMRANEKGVIGREEIKKVFNFAKLRPVFSQRKLVIIQDAHLLTLAAVNNLLKIVEEPPPFLIFFLLTYKPERLPQTIISRCVVVREKKELRSKAPHISQESIYKSLRRADINQRFILAEKLVKRDKGEIIDFLNKWLIILEKKLSSSSSKHRIEKNLALINNVKYTKGVLENTYASPRLCLERLFLKM